MLRMKENQLTEKDATGHVFGSIRGSFMPCPDGVPAVLPAFHLLVCVVSGS